MSENGAAPKLVSTMADSHSLHRLRRLLFWAGAVLLAQAAAVTIFSSLFPSTRGRSDRPVTFAQFVLVEVNVRVGVVVLLALIGVAFLLLATNQLFARYARQLPKNRHHSRWLIFSLTSSITVFLVAQLNGITDVGTLVLMYAATSAMTLFSVLQERLPSSTPATMLPLSFGAALGIVPWGIIAFQEIAAGITGDGPTTAVRILTLVMLAFAFAFATSQWTEQRRASAGRGDAVGERIFIVLSTVSTSVFAWAVFIVTS